ncbi:major facilitator superfamily domain-containing protein [Mycena alexandri]|uniref:Major facilitator superfamily domain-containing protein n=1 Tax=Mycena alexandri TaxID=1745969 RepID=A0AAD6WRP0_9AGAR|nr:major facilitator superfamily domain-containing protein [Mycena alexandri]
MTAGFELPLAEGHIQHRASAARILGPPWAHLPTLTIGLLGVQILWSVEMAYAPPYLLSLGLSKSAMAMVFLAGPLSGLVVQPVVGVLADNSTSRWGRRRPYMLAGCTLCAASMLVLGYTRQVAAIFTGRGNHANDLAARWLAVLAIYVIDFSVNAVQAVDRALLVDILPFEMQASGNAWAAAMLGLGSLVGFFVGNLNLPELLPFLGSSELQVLSVLVVVLIVTGHFTTAVLVREGVVVTAPEHRRQSLRAEIHQIFASMRTLPRVIKQIFMVQFFAWLGWFPVLLYTTTYISDLYARSIPATSVLQTPTEIAEEGTRLGSRALFFSAILALLTNLVLPAFASTASSKSSMKTSIPKLPLPTIWAFSHLLFGVCMLATFAVSSVSGATFIIAIAGVSWAVAQWAPFALLAEAILTSKVANTIRDSHLNNEVDPLLDADGVRDAESVDLTDEFERLDMRSPSLLTDNIIDPEDGLGSKAGVILGIHNVCIVIPQFLVTILCAVVFALFDSDGASGGTNGSEANKPSSVIYVFRLGAVWSFVAFMISRRMAQ